MAQSEEQHHLKKDLSYTEAKMLLEKDRLSELFPGGIYKKGK